MKSFFQGLPLQRKLFGITAVVTSVALLLVGALFFVYDAWRYEITQRRNLASFAEVVGANSAAALLFLDREAAGQTLASLRTKPEVVGAFLFDAAGVPFAEYVRPEGDSAAVRSDDPGSGYIVVDREVRREDERAGRLRLVVDRSPLRARMIASSLTLLAGLLGSFLVTLLLSARTARLIADPIIELSKLASRVAEEKDYSLRVQDRGNADEVGALARIFNTMLAYTEERDAELAGHRDNLAERVRERTAQLQGVLNAATQISIIATDTVGLITVFNSGAERMLGYSAEEMVGKRTPTLIHLESELIERGRALTERLGRPVEGFEVFVEFARQGDSGKLEWTYVRSNGSHLTVSLVINALRNSSGEPVGFLGIASDITERKRSEAELHRFRTELERRIAEATTANDSLQRQTQELRRFNEERAALGSMNELLTACANPGEAYEIFGRAASGLFPSLTGVLHVYAASRNQLMPAATWGGWPDAALPASPEDCWGLRRGKAYLGTGTTTPSCGHAGPQRGLATLCIPLTAYGEVLGVLHLRGSDAATVQSALQLASMAGDGLALTLANLGLRESLKAQSIRDPLTDLFNRRYLTETLEREFARAQRSGTPVAVIMLDVDHFKRFNDTFGHDAGDAVLQELGLLFRRSIRAEDIACRYGGEEFCLVLPQMDRDSARQRAEAIRAGAARLEIKSGSRLLGPVTLSLGVALFPEDALTIAAVLAAADAALYQAKHEGRNRVVMSRAARVSEVTAAPDVPVQ